MISVGAGAVLLAGGRGSRMGGATKALLELDGSTLLRRAIDAARGCHPITVAAGVLDPGLREVDWVQEDPAYGGPAAGVVAVLADWARRGADPTLTLILACDLAAPDDIVARLHECLSSLPADAEGVCLEDPSGRPQWLAGIYRTDALRRSAAALPDAGHNASVRALLGGLVVTGCPAPASDIIDIDTCEDLITARASALRNQEET